MAAQPGSHLLVAGQTVVASRARVTEAAQSRIVSDVAVSDDLGETWSAPALAAPPGTTAIVNGAAELDGTVVLVGALQSDSVPEGSTMGDDAFHRQLEGYDAAAWIRPPGAVGFEPVSLPDATGAAGMQYLSDVVAVSGRFVVQGGDSRPVPQTCCAPTTTPVVTTSRDGSTWTAPQVLPGPAYPSALLSRLQVLGGDVSLGMANDRKVLVAGSEEWASVPLAKGPGGDGYDRWMPGYADLTVGSEVGDLLATWNSEDNPCDCDTAFAGVATAAVLTPTRLSFDDCTFEPVGNGQSHVGHAWVLAGAVAAGFWCSDLGRSAAGVAVSPDGGDTWSTQRLSALAPDGHAELAFTSWTPWTKVGDGIVMLATATSDEPDAEELGADWRSVSGPLVAIRVS